MLEFFKKLLPKAKEYAENKSRLGKLLSKASKKVLSLADKEKRSQFREDINESILLVKDWSNNKYTAISMKSIVSVIAALLYFVIPTDLIPDFIIGSGFIDDAAIFSYLFTLIKSDLDAYKLFKKEEQFKEETNQKIITAYESAFPNNSKESFLFLTFVSYFCKNTHKKESLIQFFKLKEDSIKKHFSKKIFSIDENGTISIEEPTYLFYPFTVFTIFSLKLTKDDFLEQVKELSNIFNITNEDKEACLLYSIVLRRVLLGETNYQNILFQHDFNITPFIHSKIFNLATGKYTIVEDFNIEEHCFISQIESIFFIFNESDTFEKTVLLNKSISDTHSVSIFSKILSSLYFKNTIETQEKHNSKIYTLLNHT